ncbi:hypothetical protein SSX86_001132 [Deinandra increscens subsp. villosa]|uniref:indole-3-pyruvate monooxygenase n=1 Tax=Deinandra increscens subsp. villosa TaxID=3103831 RepID=A0AAP0DU78_9ASTR
MGSTGKDEVFTKVEGPIIVGGGPSGIAVAACLKQKGIPSLVLERNDCIASLWQHKTYDSVKLHLPKQFCELPLLGYPKSYPKYPSKNQFIAYLTSYADHFAIKPVFNQKVESAEFEFGRGVWRVKTEGGGGYESRWLVVATGENAEALVPEIAGMEGFEGRVMHASEYKNGGEFRGKKIHVLPREMFGFSTFGVAMTLLKWLPIKLVDKLILSITNYILGDTERFGLRRPKTGPLELKMTTGKTPVVDVGAFSKIKTSNIKVIEQGVREITKNGIMFLDGQELECDCIVLATGYKSNVTSWLKGNDFFADDGMPKTSFPNNWKYENGLYTAGFTRRGILGAACDATKVANDIGNQW